METSEQINELATALAKAQGEIEGAVKSSTNPDFKSKYADLAEVWKACRSTLSKHGIAVIQAPGSGPNLVFLTTRLVHSSGQWMQSVLCMPLARNDAQAVGSCLTYARRYALAAMVGISQEDDDGNAASEQEKANGVWNYQGRLEVNRKQELQEQVKAEEIKPLQDPHSHVIKGGKKYRGKSLAELSTDDIRAMVEHPMSSKVLTPSDIVNAKAALQAREEANQAEVVTGEV